MRLQKYLNEKSFSAKDIPKDFWVVFDLEEMVDELKTGKIKGLKGISSDSDIQFSFLGVARDAMLQIDSKKLLEHNKITRIMYDNPHYLVSNNLWALRRLYNASPSRWANQVFGNLFGEIQKHMKSVDKQLGYDMDYYGFRNVDPKWAKQMNSKGKIKNIKELSIVIKNYIENIFSDTTGMDYDVSLNTMKDIIFKALKNIGEIYSSENEWVVKNDYLIVPKNSIMYILIQEPDNFNKEIYDVVSNNMDASTMDMLLVFRENNLDTKYLTDVSLYKRMVKYDNLIEKLGGRYKIVKYDNIEFKKKQSEFWKR